MNYKLIERKNPQTAEQPGKYYAQLMSSSQITIDQLATRISATCTVTRHDCLAVLSALQEQIIYALQEGKRVNLDDVGHFRLVALGSGSDTPADYDLSYLKRIKVAFIPNKRLRNAVSLQSGNLKFTRVISQE